MYVTTYDTLFLKIFLRDTFLQTGFAVSEYDIGMAGDRIYCSLKLKQIRKNRIHNSDRMGGFPASLTSLMSVRNNFI